MYMGDRRNDHIFVELLRLNLSFSPNNAQSSQCSTITLKRQFAQRIVSR